MKKLMQLTFTLLCMAIMFASCGNQVDKDIAKAKDYMCKANALSEKAQAGDAAAMEEGKKLVEDMQTWMKEIEPNYPEGSENAIKFEEELKKVMMDPATACATK